MRDALEMLTVAWLALWAGWAFVGIARQRRHPILIVFLVHFFFCGVPLLFDQFMGQPLYIYTPGLFLATRDRPTAIIYCLYVSAVPLLWWWLGRSKRSLVPAHTSEMQMAGLAARLRPLYMLLIISPLIAWILAPDPGIYLQYGVSSLDSFNDQAQNLEVIFENPARYKDVIFTTSFLCIIGTAGMLTSYRKLAIAHLYLLAPWWLLAIWLNGKRYIVVMFVFVVGYILWDRGHLHGRRLVIAVAGVMLALASYSYSYQLLYRGQNLGDNDRWYENARMDYGRDDQIKLAIFAELYPEQLTILEHRGQSFLFYLVYPVPRSFWPDKPYPYAVYSTSAISLFSSPRQLGWGLTTTLLEEAIANVGWAGMLLGPVFIVAICRIGEACGNQIISALTALIAALFLAVHLNAFMVLFLLWVGLVSGWRLYARQCRT